uniref:Phosphoinositide phospholipase C n=1 Tax=Latimeria chalumnae TaxID=7897 RepID=H3A3M2_LATCH
MALLKVLSCLSPSHVLERCMGVMQSGTQMIKLKNGAKGLVRLFYLDEHRTCIRWRPSRKSEKAKITIDSIYKVAEGRQSEIFHRHADGNFDPSCCFTVYHGNHMDSLDLVTSNPEEARTWITGLKYLLAGISDEDSLAKRQRTHDQYTCTWIKQTFEEADKNGDGLLNIEEIYQLMHKLNVNLPRRKVRQMFQEADTDENRGTLTLEEFCVFYKMMSLRRDLYLLLMCFSDKKNHLSVEDLANFLRTEQKVNNVTTEYCIDIIKQFEVSEENKEQNILGVEGFTNFMRSPACDIFNPLHYEVNQDMDQPLCNYFIASSHNTYLTGDQLLSQSKTDMYARVLQEGCRCVEVDCWDGPDGEPVVQHGYTLTSKVLFRDVVEAINNYAFLKNEYPVILSVENHCSLQQQVKIAQYLKEILGDKLDLSSENTGEHNQLPSPQSLRGKILIKGKKLPFHLDADAEEGEVSDEDSADEIEDECKYKHNSSNGTNEHQVESFIRKKLESLRKESQIRDKEDPDSFTIRALLKATHEGLNMNLKQQNSDVKESLKKRQARSLMSNFSKHKQKSGKPRSKSCSTEEEGEGQKDFSAKETGQLHSRSERRRKTMKLCRALSDLVVYTNSVAAQDIVDDGSFGNALSFSETRANQLIQQKPEDFILFNQKQLIRVYPSAYRIDSSNFYPQTYWNVGCQLVALNYQSEGRMMQLNRAKFMCNGNCGYILKPQQMCKGLFKPFACDPLPACPKKQLILKIISGQQLPKPPDSMFGDRGEIIDPFVEVEIIGLPVDCCKEQTRVVDDNGFNPVWEETLCFTIHMPEMALVRFLVWDHDPIGRDFVGQRTLAFSSLMPDIGYRHVYLEGMTEASIFVHVTLNDIYGKWSPLVLNPSYTILHFLGATKNRQLISFKGFFSKNPKHCPIDHNVYGVKKRSIGERLLRRTASAPAKGRKKSKVGLQEGFSEAKEAISSAADATDRERVLRRNKNRQVRPASMPVDKLLAGGLAPPVCTTVEDIKRNQSSSGEKGGINSSGNKKNLERVHSASADHLSESHLLLSADELHQNDLTDELSKGSTVQKQTDGTEFQTVCEANYHTGYPRNQDINQPSETLKCAVAEPIKDKLQGVEHIDILKEEETAILKEEKGTPVVNVSQHKDLGIENTEHDAFQTVLHPDGIMDSTVSTTDISSFICPDNIDDFQCNKTLQDSTISRLIDAVSLTNESELGSSVSALIGQFDTTDDRTNLTVVSSLHGTNNYTFSITSEISQICTLDLNSPQKPFSLDENSKGTSLSLTADTTVFSSPETTEQSIYTIIHEDVLSPSYVCKVKDATISSAKLDSLDCSPQGSICTSPITLLNPKPAMNRDICWNGLEAYSLTNTTMSTSPVLEDTITNPVSPGSDGSSLVEIEIDDLQDHEITIQNSKKEECSQLLSTKKPIYKEITYQNSESSENCLFNGQHSSVCKSLDYLSSPTVGDQHCPFYQRDGYFEYNDLQSLDTQKERMQLSHSSTHDYIYALPCQKSTDFHSSHVLKHPSPCKSKSLGDLTSEDISCNFESKYKYISRSFLTADMKDRKNTSMMKSPQSADPLTEQLRKLVSFDQEEGHQAALSKHDYPKELVRKLSSRSQSRVRHIANRAKERQEASRQKISNNNCPSGVVFRNKPPLYHAVNRHSTGSYIAGYLNRLRSEGLEDRGMPEGACTSLGYGYNDSILQTETNNASEPEIYFLLRL